MPDEKPELPTIPPYILQQFKVIVEAVTGVPTDKIDLMATVHEVEGKPVAHLAVMLDGQALTGEQTLLLNEILAEAMAAGERIAKLGAAPVVPTKVLKDVQ